MNRCKNCKNWNNSGMVEREGRCELIPTNGFRPVNGILARVALVNEQLFNLTLLTTHEEFGCVHHERKVTVSPSDSTSAPGT